MSRPRAVAVLDPQSVINKPSFVTCVKYIGRAYRNRATELASPCRTFHSNTKGKSPDSVIQTPSWGGRTRLCSLYQSFS